MTDGEQVSNDTDNPCAKRIKQIGAHVRGLILDASFNAETAHMGVPLACADILAYLYGHFLQFRVEGKPWLGRDRLILSSGHAALAQYACLHMAGYAISLEALKSHRQLHSTATSHPEYQPKIGIEATTGADGQGIAYAVGNALAMKRLAAKLPGNQQHLFANKIIALAGDGCLMEGISYESCSLAGLWKLNNLIVIYNSDRVSLDGDSDLTFSEDINLRFRSCHWDVFTINGHDIAEMDALFSMLREQQAKPTLVVAKTNFAQGLLRTTSIQDHKNTLTQPELVETKRQLGLSNLPFDVPEAIYAYFAQKAKRQEQIYQRWLSQLNALKKRDPTLAAFFACLSQTPAVEVIKAQLKTISISSPCSISGRTMGHQVLNALSQTIPTLIACSADTSNSDRTYIVQDQPAHPIFSARNLKFGVREFAMGGIAIGLAQVGFIPVVGCYLVFSDYMRNAVRAAALMQLKIIFHLTHDSVFVGQDGPTHQPVEQLSSFRTMPQLHVVRPATLAEMAVYWAQALIKKGPTAFILSRQPITIPLSQLSQNKNIDHGGYVYKDNHTSNAVILVATGSELAKAIEVSILLEQAGHDTKIVSIPCWETLLEQPKSYQDGLFLPLNRPIFIIEAASVDPWNRLNQRATIFSVNSFGRSATIPQLEKYFQLRVEDIAESILGQIHKTPILNHFQMG